jgi:hypothetical protein
MAEYNNKQQMPYVHELPYTIGGTVLGAGAGAGLGFLAKHLLAKKFPLAAELASVPGAEDLYKMSLNTIPISTGALGAGLGNVLGENLSDRTRYKQLYDKLNSQQYQGQY